MLLDLSNNVTALEDTANDSRRRTVKQDKKQIYIANITIAEKDLFCFHRGAIVWFQIGEFACRELEYDLWLQSEVICLLSRIFAVGCRN